MPCLNRFTAGYTLCKGNKVNNLNLVEEIGVISLVVNVPNIPLTACGHVEVVEEMR
jgi:hypothetical protein